MSAEAGGSAQPLVSASQANFLRDVVRFIDAPLSPRDLSRLQKECKDTMAYKGPGSSPGAAFSVGSCVMPVGLRNTPEFNGLPATVMGREGQKLLIEFLGAPGRIFDIPIERLVPTAPPQDAAGGPGSPRSGAEPAVANALAEKLRCAMSHVEAAPEAMRVGEELHRLRPHLLYAIISEFQPTLSAANIERNWARIIQIYQAHATRVAETSGIRLGSGSPQLTQLSHQQQQEDQGLSEASRKAAEEDAEVVSQLKGVLNFIEAPLSPRTLAEIRRIRGQQQSGLGLPELTAPPAQVAAPPAQVAAPPAQVPEGPAMAQSFMEQSLAPPARLPTGLQAGQQVPTGLQAGQQAPTGLHPRPSFQIRSGSESGAAMWGTGNVSGVRAPPPTHLAANNIEMPRVISRAMSFDDI